MQGQKTMRERIQRLRIVAGVLLLGGLFTVLLPRSTDGQEGGARPRPQGGRVLHERQSTAGGRCTEYRRTWAVDLLDKGEIVAKGQARQGPAIPRINLPSNLPGPRRTTQVKVTFADRVTEVPLAQGAAPQGP